MAIGHQSFYQTALTSAINSTDLIIPLDTVPTVSEGFLVIESTVEAKREIIYFTSKDATTVTVPSGAGNGRGYDGTTAVSHTQGAAVIMAPVGAMFRKMGDIEVNSITIADTTTSAGWTPLGATPNTVTANGNNSFDLVFNSTDLTDTLTNGMRIRATRTVAAPNTAFSLDGTNDYYVKTSPNKLTFTDDFVCSAWVYLTSYAAATIVSRYNGTSGWSFELTATGQVILVGYNAGASNARWVTSYQSVPLNRWVHVAAQLDMSTFTATTTTSYVMIGGVDVPAFVSQNGTNPTALVQAGNLEVGGRNGGLQPFPGYLDQVAVYSAKVTQATILASINRALSGSETSLASAYSNGSVTDLNTTTPNDLTATNGATTIASSPFGNRGVSTTLEYGIVMANTFSTNTTVTVQVPEGCQLPTTGGISSVDYSTQNVPYGFPKSKYRWEIISQLSSNQTGGTPATNIWVNTGSLRITVPKGDWDAMYQANIYGVPSANGASVFTDLATGATSGAVTSRFIARQYAATGTMNLATPQTRSGPINVTTATLYYLTEKSDNGTVAIQLNPSGETSIITALPAYL
jgi:hypothetical protein